MKENTVKITPETLYSLSKKGSIEKIKELDILANSIPEPYELYKDYYKKLREAVFLHLKNNSINKLPEEVDKMRVKDQAQYNSFKTIAHSLVNLFNGTDFKNPRKAISKKVLHGEFVLSTPSMLSIEANKEKWLMGLYFRKEPLSDERAQIQLHLMSYLSPDKGIPTIVDVQRSIIYRFKGSPSIISFIVAQEIDFIINYLNSRSIAA